MPGTKCIVPWCGLHSVAGGDIRFHGMPRSPTMYSTWVDTLGLRNVRIPTAGRVCSRHFAEGDYQFSRPGVQHQPLKPTAVPYAEIRMCSVLQCSAADVLDSPITFYKFPVDPYFKKKWVEFVKRPGFIPTKESVICSLHFSVENYANDVLKPKAVPDVHPGEAEEDRVFPELVVEVESAGCSAYDQTDSFDEGSRTTPSPDFQVCVVHPGTPTSSRPKATPSKIRLRQKIKILQAKVKRKDEKIKNMKGLISALKRQVRTSSGGARIVSANCNCNQDLIVPRHSPNGA